MVFLKTHKGSLNFGWTIFSKLRTALLPFVHLTGLTVQLWKLTRRLYENVVVFPFFVYYWLLHQVLAGNKLVVWFLSLHCRVISYGAEWFLAHLGMGQQLVTAFLFASWRLLFDWIGLQRLRHCRCWNSAHRRIVFLLWKVVLWKSYFDVLVERQDLVELMGDVILLNSVWLGVRHAQDLLLVGIDCHVFGTGVHRNHLLAMSMAWHPVVAVFFFQRRGTVIRRHHLGVEAVRTSRLQRSRVSHVVGEDCYGFHR